MKNKKDSKKSINSVLKKPDVISSATLAQQEKQVDIELKKLEATEKKELVENWEKRRLTPVSEETPHLYRPFIQALHRKTASKLHQCMRKRAHLSLLWQLFVIR